MKLRTLLGAGALFATIFTLLALQLWIGRDPALGDGRQEPQQTAQSDEHTSVWDTLIATASSVLDEHDDEDDGNQSSGPGLQSRSS